MQDQHAIKAFENVCRTLLNFVIFSYASYYICSVNDSNYVFVRGKFYSSIARSKKPNLQSDRYDMQLKTLCKFFKILDLLKMP